MDGESVLVGVVVAAAFSVFMPLESIGETIILAGMLGLCAAMIVSFLREIL